MRWVKVSIYGVDSYEVMLVDWYMMKDNTVSIVHQWSLCYIFNQLPKIRNRRIILHDCWSLLSQIADPLWFLHKDYRNWNYRCVLSIPNKKRQHRHPDMSARVCGVSSPSVAWSAKHCVFWVSSDPWKSVIPKNRSLFWWPEILGSMAVAVQERGAYFATEGKDTGPLECQVLREATGRSTRTSVLPLPWPTADLAKRVASLFGLQGGGGGELVVSGLSAQYFRKHRFVESQRDNSALSSPSKGFFQSYADAAETDSGWWGFRSSYWQARHILALRT